MQAARVSMLRAARVSTQRATLARAGACQAHGWTQQQTRSYYKVREDSAEATGRFNNPQRSNAQELVNEIPPIETDKETIVCDGGGGSLGHPVEYIQVDRVTFGPSTCKYCGLRWIAKKK
ncbi:NADH dehydrogenase ubiquinone iron-sulfur protein 6, mitochondrial [Hondaea fermentalgiana]|uniref:NADH dehydrogenase ubiquinone iron-sulfur protein 6, mitochondrial n=1 Tax=Hondaea fermentalgiana TaxID=2315210 RepID=A0A2R5FZQ6_9STRA|nr:NADH dehydrogenase ubiquinone iron-sulfur protein 6, mitochondrial [Hondaea fermentalgiana]|eukprot:GBG24246.1 NADH dehydrogenase ubiquinone iron-sulfur protein 6, mitochondrial [Hondaea fermentalgiana]